MARNNHNFPLEDDPLWYKDAIIYEVHVRAFRDSNGDGMGDFRGLAEKLDYLKDLGVTAIWVLPFFPSPWRDDGYDIADFTEVHPAYGNLRDFQLFLREAHRRELRVITELVLNHTSDQHAWFQRARRAEPGSRQRDFYVWSDTPEKYKDARIIFRDFEPSNWTWDPVAKAYFWHRFYSHQPDLNYDDRRVRRAMFDVLDHWLGIGVDGVRLDAVPYLYEREGTNCENLPETHDYLKELRRHVDSRFKNRMLLAEANQWPEDAIAYFGSGDECHMAFQFPVMPRLFMANRMEDRFPIVDILQQTPAIPDVCQWALFLRNHDELTLEMVTDEERDYMYRVYASDPQMRINLGIRRRLAPLMGNDRRRIELMNALLFSLPGSPVVYYGDEIGMGDNIYLGDRNGVRTPMQWSPDRNAGFSDANPQRLFLPVIIDPEYHYEAINVESQLANPSSLLWWMKRLISLRKEHKAFGRGTIEFLHPENRRILAFIRCYEGQNILVLANLSRFAQYAELDLSRFKGLVPVEMFGRAEFPPPGDNPYLFSLSPYGFYWFSLEPQRTGVEYLAERPQPESIPVIAISSFDDIISPASRAAMEDLLAPFLKSRRWFLGKDRRIRAVRLAEILKVPHTLAWILLANVEYTGGDPETYLMAASVATGETADRILSDRPESVFVRLRTPAGEQGAIYSAASDKEFGRAVLDALARRRRWKGENGEFFAAPSPSFRRILTSGEQPLEPFVPRVDQSNSSIGYGDRFLLKLFRRLDAGINPDLEIGFYLSEKARFANSPPVAGAIEYRSRNGESYTLGVLQGFVNNQGDAWNYSIDALGAFFEAALTRRQEGESLPIIERHPVAYLSEPVPPLASDLIGHYLESARLMGRRIAELHLSLAARTDDPNFAPEPFTDFYRHSLFHGMIGIANSALALLRQKLRAVPEPAQAEAKHVLQLEGEIRKRFEVIRDRKFDAMRTRIHGNMNLRELLYTGRDFVIIDFEGNVARPLGERRLKRSPLRDVASMLRSFHYVSYAVLHGQVPGIVTRGADLAVLETWARFWNLWVSVSFAREYMETTGNAAFIPRQKDGFAPLLYIYILERALQELSYELVTRPAWVRLPLNGILRLLEIP